MPGGGAEVSGFLTSAIGEGVYHAMRRVAVSSSSLRAVGYDPDSQTLEIEFQSGNVYQYFGVPQEVHDDLMAADSLGTYFSASIKDHYPSRRVG